MSIKRLAASSFAALSVATLIATTNDADAINYLGSGQPGPPGWALQNWPSVSQYGGGPTSVSNFFQLAWYSQTGFTGTSKDSFEFWIGTLAGYQNAAPGTNDSDFGATGPQLGAEYYYKVVSSNAKYGTEGYRLWYISPTVTLNSPNGNGKTSGFAAGTNQYSINFDVNNYFVYNRWILTLRPVSLNYAFRNLNSSMTEDGWSRRLQGGWSVTLADTALGYQVTDSFALGVHHQYNISNFAESDFKKSERGSVGPTVTYTGLLDKGIWMAGTLDVDYTTHNTNKGINFNALIIKAF